MAKRRISFEDPKDLPMDCESIRERQYYPQNSASTFEEKYPIAQARIVYRDYIFLEMELAASYAPQNWYCFAIDAKADIIFRKRMQNLASCLPNVLIPKKEYSVDGSGHNMIFSFMECLKLLDKPKYQWKYVSLLQNYDITLRTNKEAVQIFKWLKGANDLEITNVPYGRVNRSLDWSFEAIKMFKNRSRNTKPSKNGFNPKLTFSKGYVECSLTREMIRYLFEELDLNVLLEREEKMDFGMDEIVFPTLNACDALEVPGGFTQKCINESIRVQHITRMSLWYDDRKCGSHVMRHSICLFGMEDLPTLSVLPHLFVNKMMPEFDFGAIVCWYEEIFRRSYYENNSKSRLDPKFYAELTHVKYQKFKTNALTNGNPLDLSKFDCKNSLHNGN